MVVKAKVEKKDINGGLAGVVKRLLQLKKRHIYVGVPNNNNAREEEGTAADIGNAELVYIHTHGIRGWPMRQEMNINMAKGAKYSEAYSMYIASHGSPLWQAPPRPIIEPAIEANKAQIAEKFKKIYIAAEHNDPKAMDAAINSVGLYAQNKVRAWFRDPRNNWAPNRPLTIKLKGSNRPLIDTGALRQSITYVVRED